MAIEESEIGDKTPANRATEDLQKIIKNLDLATTTPPDQVSGSRNIGMKEKYNSTTEVQLSISAKQMKAFVESLARDPHTKQSISSAAFFKNSKGSQGNLLNKLQDKVAEGSQIIYFDELDFIGPSQNLEEKASTNFNPSFEIAAGGATERLLDETRQSWQSGLRESVRDQ